MFALSNFQNVTLGIIIVLIDMCLLTAGYYLQKKYDWVLDVIYFANLLTGIIFYVEFVIPTFSKDDYSSGFRSGLTLSFLTFSICLIQKKWICSAIGVQFSYIFGLLGGRSNAIDSLKAPAG